MNFYILYFFIIYPNIYFLYTYLLSDQNNVKKIINDVIISYPQGKIMVVHLCSIYLH